MMWFVIFFWRSDSTFSENKIPFLWGKFWVMFAVTVSKYKVKIYTLILQVILLKRIAYWFWKIDG